MPNTVSTPSALRHSMMASTARMAGPPSFVRTGRERLSLAADEYAFRQGLVRPAAAADLARDRHDLAALVALSAWLVALEAVEERREQAEHRQGGSDQEPDEERAPLDLAAHAGGQPEEEHQDEPGHGRTRRACSGPREPRRWPRSRRRPR